MDAVIEKYKGKIPEKILKDFRKEALNRKLSKKDVEKVLEHIRDEYEKAKIDPGESIGVITAESFGEPGTQMTLNVFHFAGVAEVSVSSGLPRIIEIFDARKNIKTPMMEIYLEEPYSKDSKKVRKLATKIKEIKLNELALNFSINIANLQVEVLLNTKKLSEVSLTPAEVLLRVTEGMKTVKVKLIKDKLILKTSAKENELIELYKLKEKSKEIYVSGIKKIKQVLPVKNKGEYMILTAGTNLKDVLQMKGVDAKRTVCNDLFEVRKVLGIEAARQVVINESVKVIEDQGLDIDLRHIMFIADILTSSSNIKGITRSGITGDKVSVLARASFETPIKHIINASLLGERDPLNSVIENVIINQPVPLGTGLPDLMVKMIEK
jgi:DNA-directed RNA polymerase subunit A"